MNELILADLKDQYARSLGMFRDAVNLFPADEWKKGDIPYLRPAGIAYHLLECLDFYTSDGDPKTFSWTGRFGVSWETEDSEKLPDQQQVLDYLDEMESKLAGWFEAKDLDSETTAFFGAGKTLPGRVVYGIRHAQHHMSELSLELTRRGYESPKWR